MNTIHLPVVQGLEDDFAPVFGLCLQIAEFLEKVLDMNWAARRVLNKEDLIADAKKYTNRVDDISCQVMIRLKLRTTAHEDDFVGRADSSTRSGRSLSSASADDDDVGVSEGAQTQVREGFDISNRILSASKIAMLVVFVIAFIMGCVDYYT